MKPDQAASDLIEQALAEMCPQWQGAAGVAVQQALKGLQPAIAAALGAERELLQQAERALFGLLCVLESNGEFRPGDREFNEAARRWLTLKEDVLGMNVVAWDEAVTTLHALRRRLEDE